MYTLSTIRHYSFPLAVHPVNCYVVCYIDSLISFVHLNFFFYVFCLQCFHWPTIQLLSQIFRFILFMFSPTCANKPHIYISLPFISLVGHNCISTKMVVRLFPGVKGSPSTCTIDCHILFPFVFIYLCKLFVYYQKKKNCMLTSHRLLYMVISKGLHVTDVLQLDCVLHVLD